MKKFFIGLGILASVLLIFPYVSVTYHVNIHDIDRNSDMKMLYYKYAETIVEQIADSNDTIVFHIDSHGGSVSTTMSLVNKMLVSDSKLIAQIDSVAYSGGAIIATACDEIRAAKYSEILFHKARVSNILGQVRIVNYPLVDNYVTDRVLEHLTLKEATGYLNGEDIAIDGREFAKRFNTLKEGK